jgi:ribosomal protein L11 methylase PrmA
MLDGLSLIIKGLKRQSARSSVWSDYTTTSSYSAQEFELKRSFVERYVGATRPKMLLDIGCNTGSYSEIALKSGAGYIVGIEQDPAAADLAFQRGVDNKLNFLPLVLDLADPSPAQGWASQERRSFSNRCSFDGMIALAVEHHLAIGRNIPLDMLIDHMVGLAPTGVIEFVPKSDPQTQRLLSLREDIFPDHTREVFGSLLAAKARIVDEQSITGSGRVLYWYDRSAP